MSFLELRNIHASIDGNPIIQDVSFIVERGQLLTLVGPSGCGKTTTLRVIAGFLQPDQGDVLMDGKSILDLPPYKRNIGIVFQDYALFPHMNVFDNIHFGLKMHGWSKNEAKDRIGQLLALVHLEEYGTRRVGDLSGGEKQRVAVARALAPEPEILLLDEPLSALDARLRDELRREIKRIQKELELTVIYVTHDQEEALSLSTVIGVMNAGKLEQVGDPVQVYRKPATLFTAKFLGSANLLSGKVVGDAGKEGAVIVETKEGRMTVEAAWIRPVGTELTLFFRGENTVLEPLPTPPTSTPPHPTINMKEEEKKMKENIINGTLEDLDFFGDEIRARVKGQGGGLFTLKFSSGQKEFDPWALVGKKVVVRVEKFGVITGG